MGILSMSFISPEQTDLVNKIAAMLTVYKTERFHLIGVTR